MGSLGVYSRIASLSLTCFSSLLMKKPGTGGQKLWFPVLVLPQSCHVIIRGFLKLSGS